MKLTRKTQAPADALPVNPADRPIPMRHQFAYALNELASNPIYTITLSFLTFFYTDVLGMDAGLVGVLILISKIFDGISDLWAGNLIDHTHTKAGSARPWVLRSSILMAASYILLFSVPNCGTVGKAVYIFVTYNFAMTLAFTIYNCAINAMPVYMSNDSSSRASAYSIRMIFAGVVQMVFSMLCLNIVDAMGGGQRGWILMAAIFATLTLIISVIVYFGTKENVTEVQKDEEEKVPFRTAITAVLKNKYWFLVFGMILIIVFHQVATLTVGVYYAKYILFDEKLAGNLVTYHHLGAAVGMLSMPFILKGHVSKKKAVVVAACCMLLGSIVAIIRSEGVCLILSLALRGCGFGVVNSLYYGMLADSVDYGEWKTGIRSAAVTTSAGSVGQKLGSGLGTALIGLALSAAGYNGLAATQTSAAVGCIRFIFVVFPVILYVALLVLIHFYNLDDQLPQIKSDLEQRKTDVTEEEKKSPLLSTLQPGETLRVGEYTIEALTPTAFAIDDDADESMYLVCGSEKALMIDTGSAAAPVMPVIRTLWDGPVELALTHAHFDHMLHCDEFDTVYLHQADIAAWDKVLGPIVWASTAGSGKKPKHYNVKGFKALIEGSRISLGDKELRVIYAKGHTPGSIILVDNSDKLLFTGDAFGSGSYAWMWMPGCSSVSEYKESLHKLIPKLEPLQDYRMMGGHRRQGIPSEADPNGHTLTLEDAKAMETLCTKLLSGGCQPVESAKYFGFQTCTYRDGLAGIVLRKGKIR